MIRSSRARRRVELVRHARSGGLVLRVLALMAAVFALACVHLAAGDPLFGGGTLTLDGLVVIVTAVCLVYPDGHAGTAVLALLTAKWLVAVDHPAGWWSLAMGASFAVFHATLAAAAVAPPSATWTPAMTRRWARRSLVLVGFCGLTALAVAGASNLDLRGDTAVFTAALIALTAGGLWIATERRHAP